VFLQGYGSASTDQKRFPYTALMQLVGEQKGYQNDKKSTAENPYLKSYPVGN